MLKPHALIIGKTVQICVTKCVLLKGFKQSLFCAVSVSLTLKCEVHWKNLLILTAAWLGWVLLVHQFLAAYLTAFCHSASCHKIQCRKLWPFFPFFVVMRIVMNRFLPLVLSQLTLGHLLKKVELARNLSVPTKAEIESGTSERCSAMEGPSHPK